MNLKDYIDIYQLLQVKPATHEQNRSFGIEYQGEPLEQLMEWRDRHSISFGTNKLSDSFDRYLYGIDIFTGVIALLLGVGSGAALLSYSGAEPVNVVYFITIAIIVPLLTMSLALWSMIRANSSRNTMVYLAPAYWMEKVLALLPGKLDEAIRDIKLNPLVFNWLIIKRAQMLGLIFALGLLVALLLIVSTRDIAFAWSTTLHISPQQLHSMTTSASLPWSSFVPSVVPSLELIEQSQYFRLGGKLSSDMVSHASILGEWWKFLALATLFYAVLLRFIMWIVASIGFGRAIKSSILSLDGVSALLNEMNTPVVSTISDDSEPAFDVGKNGYSRTVRALDERYDTVIGWSISTEALSVTNDSLGVSSDTIVSAGGSNSLKQDNELISNSGSNVLLYVKSWEPPTMDFVDFMTDLSSQADKITVAPIGTAEEQYRANPKDAAVWGRKLAGVDGRNVWMLSPKHYFFSQ